MTDNEIRVAIARLDGWVEIEGRVHPAGYNSQTGERRILPDYLNSHDALAPVLAGLSEEDYGDFDEFSLALARIVGAVDVDSHRIQRRLILRATPRQKCEALMRGPFAGERIVER